jgi:hypothetical protein
MQEPELELLRQPFSGLMYVGDICNAKITDSIRCIFWLEI